MDERPHVDYFDGLRIFAALSVIFMHTAAVPLRAGINTDWHLLNVCTALAFTAVPLFFMMSGYLLMTSRKTADIRAARGLDGRGRVVADVPGTHTYARYRLGAACRGAA